MSDKPDECNLERSWESVARELTMKAEVGRLFAGTIHNLNGVLQAFSMQVELLQSMFSQSEHLLSSLEAVLHEGPGSDDLKQLQTILKQRANLTSMLEEKTAFGLNILQRNVMPFQNSIHNDDNSIWPNTVNTILQQEIDFLCADSFFKHKVVKNTLFSTSNPQTVCTPIEMHQLCFALLENSLTAMKIAQSDRRQCQLNVSSHVEGEFAVVSLQDSGIGVSEDSLNRIFDPFYTTWEDKRGLGLYYVKTLCEKYGGEVACTNLQNPTIFEVRLPLKEG